MLPLSTTLPASQRTAEQVRLTLNLTLLLFAIALLLQLPALYYFARPGSWQSANWLSHFLALIALGVAQRLMSLNSLKVALFSLYYSYLTWVLLLWPGLSNTHYYYLLAVVITGFVFTRSEQLAQTTVLTGALFLFALFSVVHYQPQLEFGLLRLTNDLTLGALSLGIYRVLRHQTLSRWHGLRGAHQVSVSTLSQLLPKDPEQPTRFWQPGKTRRYQFACVLFADLSGYTALNRQYGDRLTLSALKNLYSNIDKMSEQFPIEKIKTNGDQYMAVSRLSSELNYQCCEDMYRFACALHAIINRYSSSHKLNCTVRIGIASGPLTAGIIGNHRPYFDIWGETVNLAACLEQQAGSDYVSACPITMTHLPDHLVATQKPLASAKHPDTRFYYQLKVTEQSPGLGFNHLPTR